MIAQIELEAEQFAKEVFEPAYRVIEKFYQSVRKVETSWEGQIEAPVYDEDGRLTYQKNHLGEYIEDWSQLTGQDADEAIFGLQRVITEAGDRVSKLYMRAQFAYYVHDDEYWTEYKAPIEGTVNDREARAKIKTRDSRYFYMLQFWYWKTVNTKLESIKYTKRDIEFAVQRRLNYNTDRVYRD